MHIRHSLLHIIKSGLLDFGPILVFVLVYSRTGFFKATWAIMITTILVTVLAFYREKRIPYFALIFTFLTVGFGYMTIHFHDPKFLKIKDTLQDLVFAVAILGSIFFKFPLLKNLFGHLIRVSEHTWNVIAWNWGLHFLVLAMCNEYVRHNFNTKSWVVYKFLAMAATIIHTLILVYAYRKEILPPDREFDKEKLVNSNCV